MLYHILHTLRILSTLSVHTVCPTLLTLRILSTLSFHNICPSLHILSTLSVHDIYPTLLTLHILSTLSVHNICHTLHTLHHNTYFQYRLHCYISTLTFSLLNSPNSIYINNMPSLYSQTRLYLNFTTHLTPK